MNQQINLYQPMFRKQRVIISAVTMLQVGIFFLLVLSSLYAYQNSQLKPIQKQLASLETELIQLGNQFTAMESSLKGKNKSKLLENEIAKLSRDLEKRERISNVLSSQSFGNTSGFSSYLEAFARGHVQGTWLTHVKIRQGGSSLGLKGKTLSSELVPVYWSQTASQNYAL
ncbi:MAG: hypothetical protein O7D86_01390 [Proteobacteria bacterium]|nr:hypothetical protein [Pseudomonadota bacterium]